jgi:catechol 2,3-dioxygenase
MDTVPSDSAALIRYRPRRLGHVNLFVSDFRRSMDFYKAVCGFEETARETTNGGGFLSNGNTHHDIGISDIAGYARYMQGKPNMGPPERGAKPGLNHFGWEMETEADLVAAYKRAMKAGLNPRVTDAGTGRSNYLFDPDGTQHQFYVDKIKNWRSVYIGGETVLHGNPPWHPLAGEPSTERNFDEHPTIRRVEHAPLHPIRVTHATMIPKDFEAALAWYVEIAGFAVQHKTPRGDCVYLGGSASPCDVILLRNATLPSVMHHASFVMAPDEDLDAAAAILTRIRIDIVARIDAPHKRSLFIRDPDGLLLEFYVPKPGGFEAVDRASVEDLVFLA